MLSFPASSSSNIRWKSQPDAGCSSLLEDLQAKSCGGAEVSSSPLHLFSTMRPLSFLSAPSFPAPTSLTSCTPSPHLPPLCLFICLLVTLSVHPLSLSLPLPHSRSVTGEFPELITGGYPRVQRGAAHLQAEGAREGCLITFSAG